MSRSKIAEQVDLIDLLQSLVEDSDLSIAFRSAAQQELDRVKSLELIEDQPKETSNE